MLLNASPSLPSSPPDSICTRWFSRPSATASVPAMRAVIGRMSERPHARPTSTTISSARLMAASSPFSFCRATAYASRVGCSTITIQSEVRNARAHGEHALAAGPGQLLERRAIGAPAPELRDDGIVAEVHAARDARALLGVAVREQLAAGTDDEHVALACRRGCGPRAATAPRC